MEYSYSGICRGTTQNVFHSHKRKNEKKSAKGVVQNRLKHEHYKTCLMENKVQLEKIKGIQSVDHHLYTIELNKIALSPLDDKRYILNNGCDTLAYGHYKIAS